VITVWFLPRLLSKAQLLIYPLALVATSELVLIIYKSLVFIDRAIVIALSIVNRVNSIPNHLTVVGLDRKQQQSTRRQNRLFWTCWSAFAASTF
jgi:hypothetical protein